MTRDDGVQNYFAHFDRRHNVNFVAAYQFRFSPPKTNDKIKDQTDYPFEVSVRWNLGSGFPFTRTQGFMRIKHS